MLKGSKTRSKIYQLDFPSLRVHVESITSDFSVNNPPTMMKNFQAFCSANSEVEKSHQVHRFNRREIISICLVPIPNLAA
jgi:hypothetical protein